MGHGEKHIEKRNRQLGRSGVFLPDPLLLFAAGLLSAADVAAEVAAALASYDVDAAQRALRTAGSATLPEELRGSYEALIANLSAYPASGDGTSRIPRSQQLEAGTSLICTPLS